jgi:para-nitrobenzyl esterase
MPTSTPTPPDNEPNNSDLDPQLLLTTEHGQVLGSAEAGYRSWKGIRYAAAPIGELRWRAPRPPHPWQHAADATKFGPACPQPVNPMISLAPGIGYDEDCLTLNVSAAKCDRDHPAPVMVWIHGGAYIFGGSNQPLFEAASLLSTAPMVIVTVNYRLGALGFLDLSSFSTEEHHFDSNLALRDVLLALNWVQTNIAAFGGDPTRVTLAGESAGGALVSTLLTVPAAAGLFQRAIVESAPATSVYDQGRAAKVAAMFLEDVDISPTEIGRLRELPVDQLVESGFSLYSKVPGEFPGTLAYAPVVDGDLVPDYPLNRFRSGRSHPVPLLIGTNKDEAAMFKMMKSPLMPITSAAIMQMFSDMAADNPKLTLPSEAQVGSAYVGMRLKAKGLGVARDLGFRMPTVWLAEGHSQVSAVYLYRFDWATPMLRLLGIGATHATELPYLWGNLISGPKDITFKLGGLSTGRQLSRRMQARWRAFIAGHEPNTDSSVPWPAYHPATAEQPAETERAGADRAAATTRATLVIDATDHLEYDLDRELRLAWGDEVLSFL